MSDLFNIVLTASLTLVGGAILLVLTQFFTRRQKRKSVQAALRSEIQSILAIVEWRDYIPGFSNFIETIKREPSVKFFQIRVAEDYDAVFRSNCNKLGLLAAETAAKTVRFYHQVSSIVEDLRLFAELPHSPDLQKRYGLNVPRECVAFQERTLQLARDTVDLGNELIQELAYDLEFPMNRTLLAVGVAVLISMMFVPHQGALSVLNWHGPFFSTNSYGDPIIWESFVLQTIFLAVAAAVIVNLFPRKPTR